MENHNDESILIFHSCSTNINIGEGELDRELGPASCEELHIGNTPRSIMTKGNSTNLGTPYGNFIRGNKDKLMISYRREQSHDYSMFEACGILFEGEIHFFGGKYYNNGINFQRQHFVIETKRSGQLVGMTKKDDLEIELNHPLCSSFEIPSEYLPWFKTNVVILCFAVTYEKSCFSFNGKQLTYTGDSNYEHLYGGMTKYKENLLAVGGEYNQMTEIFKIDETKNFSWSIIESDIKFTPGRYINCHSLVTVQTSDINEEYVLLIGGVNDDFLVLKNVFKFNGTWFPFGQLNKPRFGHNSIYWNGAVHVIGGVYDYWLVDIKRKVEIWNVQDHPDQFKTEENWPELFGWFFPHLFIVPDSFFPDH